jgi:ATP-dependent RNA helicase DDX21
MEKHQSTPLSGIAKVDNQTPINSFLFVALSLQIRTLQMTTNSLFLSFLLCLVSFRNVWTFQSGYSYDTSSSRTLIGMHMLPSKFFNKFEVEQTIHDKFPHQLCVNCGGARRIQHRQSTQLHAGSYSQSGSFEQLSFAKTVKINPDFRSPIKDMKFDSKIEQALLEKGFTNLTPVQSQSYPEVLSGKDVVARSRTGTGKTLAFGLPLIQQLVTKGLTERKNKRNSPLILVMEPTRELALQVADELKTICQPYGLKVLSVFGGVPFGKQVEFLVQGVDIVIATPGRLLDHLQQKTINLQDVTNVVLDEGDTMLEMGFQEDVENILSHVKSGDRSKKVQMMLFSATMPGWICKITDRLMKDPIFLDAVQEGENRLAETITHYSVLLPESMERMKAVISYLEDIILTKNNAGQAIVFANTKNDCDRILREQCFGHLTAAVLHGDVSQSGRLETLRAFREKTVDILVATDVAARGLDISGVELVVHIEPPRDVDSYVHRSGRTGRAGRSGSSILFHTRDEETILRNLQKEHHFSFIRTGPPTAAAICQASEKIVQNRLNSVTSVSISQFLPCATQLLADARQGKLFQNNDGIDNTDVSAAVDPEAGIQELIARCVACIGNRASITVR